MNNCRSICWFGKLPSIGDFCCRNLQGPLLNSIDSWLSGAMLQGQEKYGTAWTNAYFQAPIYGFLLETHAVPELEGRGAVGIVMPSVDKAGRAFPFLLMVQLEQTEMECLNEYTRNQWFLQAHVLCASALDENWTLEKLEDALNYMPNLNLVDKANEPFQSIERRHSHWWRIATNAYIQRMGELPGLPDMNAFEMLLGLRKAP